jgi:hypothetical protein
VAEKDKDLWDKKLIGARLSMTEFSNDKFFGYSDSSIEKVIDGAMKEDEAPLRKKVRQASIFSNDLSSNIDELDCLLKATINLRSYSEATRLRLNEISEEIK